MQNEVSKIKAAAVGVLALAASHFGVLVLPMALLVAGNLLDYVTGIFAAPRRGQARSSVRGYRGIAKKVSMWLLVAVGMMVDMLLSYLADVAGIQVNFTFPVGCIVCVWLLANELISVIENIADLGVKVPFLLPLVQWVRQKAQKAAAVPEQEEGLDEGEKPEE